MEMETQMRTADGGTIAGVGQRLFNYYDRKWGVIETSPDENGWFTFRHDDGSAAILNGERVAVQKPHWVK